MLWSVKTGPKWPRKNSMPASLLVITGLFLAITGLLISSISYADDDSLWLKQGQVTLNMIDETDKTYAHLFNKNCTLINAQRTKYTYVSGLWVKNGTAPINGLCIINTSFGSIGYQKDDALYPYIRFGDTGVYTKYLDDIAQRLIIIPESNMLAFKTFTDFAPLNFLENVSRANFQLIQTQYDSQEQYDAYVSNPDNPMTMTKLKSPGSDQDLMVGQLAVSSNGQWMVLENTYSFMRFNLNTKELLAFSLPIIPYDRGTNPTYDMSISDDGRYVVIAGGAYSIRVFKIYDLSGCTVNSADPLLPNSDCKQPRDLNSELLGDFPADQNAVRVGFSPSGENIQFSISQGPQYDYSLYAVTAPGKDLHLLEYLAMGDSFSSGEGDGNGNRYYLPGTDGDGEFINPTGIPDYPYNLEKCHLSLRSYPYLLAKAASLSQAEFRSVACSGADMKDVTQISSVYRGNYDQMSRLTEEQMSGVKQDALEKFIPGREAQIKFLEKYKPRVATIGIGGNDIGFADKVKSCILSVQTCDYASIDRGEAISSMKRLYNVLKEGFKSIKVASPTTRIYAVGYPQIITLGGDCAINVHLDQLEQEYAFNLVDYLNNTIRAAASSAGIQYLDLRDALDSANLCSSVDDIAVNGLTKGDDIFGIIGKESYHPNELGHLLEAGYLTSEMSMEKITEFNPCAPKPDLYCNSDNPDMPEPPAYFNTEEPPLSPAPWAIIAKSDGDLSYDGVIGVIPREGSFRIDPIGSLGGKAGGKARFMLHSEPIDLGEFTLDEQGEVDAQLSLPTEAELGYHTLRMELDMPGGDIIDYYQPIVIYNSADDFDGDGVANYQDSCNFVDPIGQDTDHDGIDDACDGYLHEEPNYPLYRARNGNPEKGELPDRIYVERDVLSAKTDLGIIGDYDPDEDGWALVGHTDTPFDKKLANFWVDELEIPHITLRSDSSGCVQLTPVDLTKVLADQDRLMDMEGEDMKQPNPCRSAGPNDDTDLDGTPDIEQQLYRARNGNPEKGELADAVYVERNIVATEARGGSSDYDPDGDGWAVIGYTTDPNKFGQMRRIVVPGASGGIFTQDFTKPPVVQVKTGNICKALTPEDYLDVVIFGEERLLKTYTQPLLVSC